MRRLIRILLVLFIFLNINQDIRQTEILMGLIKTGNVCYMYQISLLYFSLLTSLYLLE